MKQKIFQVCRRLCVQSGKMSATRLSRNINGLLRNPEKSCASDRRKYIVKLRFRENPRTWISRYAGASLINRFVCDGEGCRGRKDIRYINEKDGDRIRERACGDYHRLSRDHVSLSLSPFIPPSLLVHFLLFSSPLSMTMWAGFNRFS